MEFLQVRLEECLNEIFQIGEESFEDFYPRIKFLQRLKDKRYWIFAARENGAMAGFKIFYEDNSQQIYDWLDAVKPVHRRNGIASRLMDMEIDFARQRGYSKIKLKTHEGHSEMISLCKKFGFVETGRESHHWKDSIDKEAIYFELSI